MYYVNKQLNNVNKKTILVYLLNFLWKKKFGFFEKESKNCAELWFFIRKKRYEKYYVKKNENFFGKSNFRKNTTKFCELFWKYVKKIVVLLKLLKLISSNKKKLSPTFSPPKSLYCVINTPCTKFNNKKNWRSSSKDCSKKKTRLKRWPTGQKKIHYAFPRFLPTLEKTLNVYILSCDTVFKME